MASGTWLWSAGPTTSRSIRILLYLGEGAMTSALLYILIAIGGIVSYLITAGLITETGFLMIGAIGVISLVIAIRNIWAVRRAGGEASQSWVYEEWTAERRWGWSSSWLFP